MTYIINLKIEIDAVDDDDAKETARDIASDLMCWPCVMSVEGGHDS